MRWLRHLAWAAAWVLLATQFSTGCGDSGSKAKGGGGDAGSGGRDQEGLDMCCELGAVCHDEGPAASAEKGECHEMAHENNPTWCKANYERCLDICAPSGEGGEGGEHQQHFCVSE